MADETLSKMKLKLGEHEFEFEGDAETGREAYKAFLEAVRGAPSPSAPAPNPSADSAPPPPPLPPPPTGSNGGAGQPSGDVLENATLKRIFAERDAVISLLALPRTPNAEADGLLVLLYGYQQLKSSDYPVTGVRLMQAAKQSGIQVERIDRVISANEAYVLSAGQRRGKRYQLNNQGIVKAKEIISAIFG